MISTGIFVSKFLKLAATWHPLKSSVSHRLFETTAQRIAASQTAVQRKHTSRLARHLKLSVLAGLTASGQEKRQQAVSQHMLTLLPPYLCMRHGSATMATFPLIMQRACRTDNLQMKPTGAGSTPRSMQWPCAKFLSSMTECFITVQGSIFYRLVLLVAVRKRTVFQLCSNTAYATLHVLQAASSAQACETLHLHSGVLILILL